MEMRFKTVERILVYWYFANKIVNSRNVDFLLIPTLSVDLFFFWDDINRFTARKHLDRAPPKQSQERKLIFY